jgi:hypothetical protein
MALFFFLTTFVSLLFLAFGLFKPSKVFLGPTAAREKVLKVYGAPAFISFILFIVAVPKDARPKLPERETSGAEAVETSSPQPGQKSVHFIDMIVPGRMADAKNSGFTNCTSAYSGYLCRREKPTEIYGVAADFAEIVLNGDENFSVDYKISKTSGRDARLLSAEELSYGNVEIHFSKPDFDYNCLAKIDEALSSVDWPTHCVKNKNTIRHLTDALEKEGWLKAWRSRGGTQTYFHPKQNIGLDIHEQSNDWTVNVYGITDEDLSERVAEYTKRISREKDVETKANAIIREMNN